MQHYNDFCLYCTGNNKKLIRECSDKNCPFLPFKYGGLEKEVEQEICQKLMVDTGMVEE